MQTSGRLIAGGAAMVGVLALAACGGGGGAKAVPAAAKATAAPMASATVQLTVPNRVAVAQGRRGVQYVSPNTQSVMFTANGTIVTKINLTGSICVPNAQSTAKLCTFSVTAPVGSVTFAMQAYDQQFVAGVLPMGTNTLSAATNFTATIAEGSANTVLPVIMGGIPASINLAFSDGTTTATISGASSKQLIVTVYDASGAVIVAPGAFVDASGNAAPIALTSTIATSHIGYTLTPAATGVTGAIGAAISLAEPDDRVAFASDGSTAYVAASDTLGHSTVPNHTGGATTTLMKFGFIATPAFTPKLISPLTAAQFTALGHQGALVSDTISQVGFIGDVSGSCAVPSSGGPGNVTQIGGITTDGAADPFFYVHVIDPNVTGGEALYTLTTSFIASSNCTPTNQAVPVSYLTPFGIAAANGQLYGVASSGTDFIFGAPYAMSGISSISLPAVMNGGADFGTAAVAVTPTGSSAVVQFASKKKVALISSSGSQLASQALSTMFDPYPYGLTVDGTYGIFANDMTSATFGANGGVDEFDLALSSLTGKAQVNAAIVSSGPAGSLQNMTVGSYNGSPALYVACGDGIEVFGLPLSSSTPSSPVTTIAPVAASTAFGLAANGDGRVWLLLANGQVEALPPY
jgi:hypothetical protein